MLPTPLLPPPLPEVHGLLPAGEVGCGLGQASTPDPSTPTPSTPAAAAPASRQGLHAGDATAEYPLASRFPPLVPSLPLLVALVSPLLLG